VGRGCRDDGRHSGLSSRLGGGSQLRRALQTLPLQAGSCGEKAVFWWRSVAILVSANISQAGNDKVRSERWNWKLPALTFERMSGGGMGAGSCGSLNSSAKQQEAYSPAPARAMALWHSQKQDGRYLSYSGQSLAGIGISPSTPWWKASGARVPKSSSS
jgi:hypothetical protein